MRSQSRRDRSRVGVVEAVMRRAPKRYGRRIDAPPADIDKSTPDASVAAVVQQACKKPRECVDNQPAASQHTRPAWLAVRFARVAELVDALASGASGRSEEHTSELQSLM